MVDAQSFLALCAICSLATSEAFLSRLCGVESDERRAIIVDCVRENFATPELRNEFEGKVSEHWGTDDVNRVRQLCSAFGSDPGYRLPEGDLEGYKDGLEEGMNKCLLLAK